MDDLKDVLAAIKKTSNMRDKINKGLGVKKEGDIIDSDLYEFEYRKPDLDFRNWMLLHGGCITEGQKQLRKWGYEFLQIRHLEQKDASYAGAKCNHCGKLLDAKTRDKYLKDHTIRISRELAEYAEERAIREEWEAEQILLGKL